MRGISTAFTRLCLFTAFLFNSLVFFSTFPARAGGGCNCASIQQMHSTTRNHVCDCYKQRMDDHEKWILEEFWPLMEDALKGSASQQTQGQATQLQSQNLTADANNMIATRRAREQEVVQTMRRFSGAEHAVCTPASIGQGLTASNEFAKGTNSNITKAMLRNAVGNTNGRSFNGPADDRARRFQAMISTYCQASDFGGAGDEFGCRAGEQYANLDISFGELYSGRDLNDDGKIDASDFFEGTVDAGEEQEAWNAFTANLGLQKPFDNVDTDALARNRGAAIDIIMQQRQVLARRSVAMAAFTGIQANQSPGSGASVEYLRGLYEEQGRDSSVIPDNPSAYQQEQIVYNHYYADPNELIQHITDSPEQVTRHQAIAAFHMNAQLWNITNELRKMNAIIAGTILPELEDEYNRVQAATQQINRTR